MGYLNAMVPSIKAPIPNINIIEIMGSSQRTMSKYFALVDLANMFYSVSVSIVSCSLPPPSKAHNIFFLASHGVL